MRCALILMALILTAACASRWHWPTKPKPWTPTVYRWASLPPVTA